MSRSEVQSLIPNLNKSYRGALHTPSDMRAEPWMAVPALARLAAAEGVLIRENCAARRLDIKNGQISGVITEWSKHLYYQKYLQAVLSIENWRSAIALMVAIRLPPVARMICFWAGMEYGMRNRFGLPLKTIP